MIKIQNLSKKYDNLTVLKDISLEINQGDIFGIIGQSGAGKSTLLRCINGLEPYDEGSITIEGKEIASLDKRELHRMQSRMGMIFQNFNLLNRLNVYDNVALPLQFWGKKKNAPESREKIMHLLKLVGLEDRITSKPSQLSGGQKQRVAIARALVLDPQILLCDEATSALDPQITKDILTLLSQINREMHITIVMVTHQMEVVKEICTKMVYIENGESIAVGKPEELFVAPNSPIKNFVRDAAEFLPQTGVNIRLYFNNDATAEDSVITKMARELNVNFAICDGRLENYHGTIMGSLAINVSSEDQEAVTSYLSRKNVPWEYA